MAVFRPCVSLSPNSLDTCAKFLTALSWMKSAAPERWPTRLDTSLSCSALFRVFSQNTVAWEKLSWSPVSYLEQRICCYCFYIFTILNNKTQLSTQNSKPEPKNLLRLSQQVRETGASINKPNNVKLYTNKWSKYYCWHYQMTRRVKTCYLLTTCQIKSTTDMRFKKKS